MVKVKAVIKKMTQIGVNKWKYTWVITLRITFHMSTLDPTNQNCPISEERISEQLG